MTDFASPVQPNNSPVQPNIGMFVWKDGDFVYTNDAFVKLVGEQFSAIDFNFADFLSSEDTVTHVTSDGPNGARIDLQISASKVQKDGSVTIFGTVFNLSAWTSLSSEQKANEESYLSLLEHHPDAVCSLSPSGNLLMVNPACERLIGYLKDEMVSIGFPSVIHQETLGRALNQFDKALLGIPQTYDMTLIHRSGRLIPVRATNIPIVVHGEVTNVVCVLRDATQRQNSSRAVNPLSSYDPLTALPNRALFRDTLAVAIDTATARGDKFAVLCLDLKRFKVLNDTLGNEIGDRFLCSIADRLVRSVRGKDTVARTGGDEFSLLLMDVDNREDVLALAQRIVHVVEEEVTVGKYELQTTCRVGISLFPDDGTDVATLVENAETAMNSHANSGNSGSIAIYHRNMTNAALERLQLETDLRRAIQREELVLHYQPRISLSSGRIIGLEALLRWNHPRLGMVSPATFIPLAEETGLIVPIGEWVLKMACRQAKAWMDEGLAPTIMAVNLSAKQFHEGNLLNAVANAWMEASLDPRHLELEITESVIMHNEEATITILNQLRAMGVRIAVDDFGTGYSSLTYLKNFPIDSIKIDQSFVCDIAHSPGDQAIASAIISLAHSLSLTVVAEGVETSDQLTFLHSRECDEMQGYLYSPPVAASQCREMLHKQVFSPGELILLRSRE